MPRRSGEGAALGALLSITLCFLLHTSFEQASARELGRQSSTDVADEADSRVSRHGMSHRHAQHRGRVGGGISEEEHKQTMCIEPVDKNNLDCHLLGKVGRIDPYLLHRQYVSGKLPSLAITPEECKKIIRSASQKAAFDKITVPHLSRTLSKRRRSSSRVLCMVVTTSNKHDSDLHDVRMTWGKKCDGFIAFSNATNLDVSAIQTPVAGGDSYKNLGEKTRAMFKYAWYHFGHQFDWFFKADDDTFVIMENLIQYLRSEEIQREREAGKGVYLGHRMQIPNYKFLYTSGGGGYLLDRIAVRELVHNMEKLSCQSSAEDLQVGKCLFQSGITVYNTTDANDEEMFHPFNPSMSVNPEAVQSTHWYVKYRPMGIKLGLEGVSVNTTTFHYMRGGAQVKAYKYLKYCTSEKESAPSQQ